MIKQYEKSDELIAFWCSKTAYGDYEARDAVRKIISEVRIRKDAALREFTEKFDGAAVDSFRVAPEDIKAAGEKLPDALKQVFMQAAENIRRYHERQKPKSWTEKGPDGTLLGLQYSPVESAGIYVPGGKAVYPSTVLMNVIPAQVAGVPRIAVVSPPGKDGKVSSAVLACAAILGINEVYAVGGAQAVAALAFGTESVPSVVKITGPGNKYVNEAKMQVFGKVGIDIPAGPTELVILADESVPVSYVVWDIFAQAEHDTDAKVAVLTTSGQLFDRLGGEIEKNIENASKKEIISEALRKNSSIMLVESEDEAVRVINELAPEHLELMTDNAEQTAGKVQNAGAVFLGKYTPNAVGDYWAGPNHTLPTSLTAKFASPLNVLDFMKFTSCTGYTKEALRQAVKQVGIFAREEQLEAHARSVEVRYE